MTPFADPLIVRLPADPDSMPLLRRVIALAERGGRLRAGDRGDRAGHLRGLRQRHRARLLAGIGRVRGQGYALCARRVLVTVSDRGQWREPRGVNRGRGLQLMAGLMDSVEVDRQAHGTAVRLGRRLDMAA